MRGRSKPPDPVVGAALDGIRLALAAVTDSPDLATALQQICIGATRVCDGPTSLLVLERAGTASVAAAVGDLDRGDVAALVRDVQTVESNSWRATTDVLVAPFRAEAANGELLVHRGRPGTLPALELFAHAGAAVVDLQIMRRQAADAAHRVQPVEAVPAVLASLCAGDGVLVVGVDDFAGHADDISLQSAISAAGIHLLNATRPPGDVIVTTTDGQFLVVLRELKAPIETVAQRLLDTWLHNRPAATLSLGAALHVDGRAPLHTLEHAEAALGSAVRLGGGRAHISSLP